MFLKSGFQEKKLVVRLLKTIVGTFKICRATLISLGPPHNFNLFCDNNRLPLELMKMCMHGKGHGYKFVITFS